MNTLIALCAVGAEKILGNEIKHLGYKLVSNAPGRVSFIGDDAALFKANLCLRTADRVYLQLAEYDALDFDDLYNGAYDVPWQDFLHKDSKIVVDKVKTYKSKLNSEHSIQGIVHKAIYSKLGDVWHMSSLPETGEESDVRVYVDDNKVLVLLDLSGLPLHKRGYRVDGGLAPLRETTAAVLLQEMMWRRKTPLHDPFCGSGTIPIEATLYAFNVAPGFGRRFALENLPIYNADLAKQIRDEEASKIRTDVEVRITGSDIDAKQIDRARKNAEYACVMAGRALKSIGVSAHIQRPDFIQSDFVDLSAPFDEGLLLCNPPYGERIGTEEEAKELYQKMDSLWTDFPNWDIGVITSNEEFMQSFNHNANLHKSLKAGNLDTEFYIYNRCPSSIAKMKTPAKASNNNHKKDGKKNFNKGPRNKDSNKFSKNDRKDFRNKKSNNKRDDKSDVIKF